MTRDIVGEKTIDIEVKENARVGELMNTLKSKFPAFNDLKSLLVAVNSDYAEDSLVIKGSDEIALIPPVSVG